MRKGEYIPEQQAEQRVLRPVGRAVVRTLQRKGVYCAPAEAVFREEGGEQRWYRAIDAPSIRMMRIEGAFCMDKGG